MDSTCAAWLLVGTLIGMVMVTTPAAIGAEYYLSPDGDDAAAGDPENPWQSIAKANEALQPGDTAIFLEGEYAGTITPDSNGTPDAPIIYRSVQPGAARLMADGVALTMQFNDHEHIIVEDFHVDGMGEGGWFSIDDSNHVTIRGCIMHRSDPRQWIRNSTQIKLLDNVFSKDTVSGETVTFLNCSRALVEGNSFTRVGHCPFILSQTTHSVVRGNVFHSEWGRNHVIWSSGRILFEDNIITRAHDSAWSADSYSKNLYDDSIFRFNRIYDNLAAPMCTSSYIYSGVSPTHPRWRWPFRAMNSRIYHNTFTDNLGHAWHLSGMNVCANKFQNNIFYRNDPYGDNIQVVWSPGISSDNQFITNLFRGTEPDQTVVRYRGEYLTARQVNEKTPTVGGFWSQFHENIDADPAFVDPGNRDYRLSADSGAIDTGRPLALALGDGTGTEVPVTDGIPFYDGFGIDGEEGDFIAVGDGDNIAQIEKVELRYYRPAILHLDREITWEDGMPVSFPWTGEGPDIGAYEHEVKQPTRMIALAKPAVTEPGQPINFTLDTLGKEIVSAEWNLGDGTRASGASTTHAYDSGHYAVVVRATFATGREGVAATFVKVEPPVSAGAPLVHGSFEDEDIHEWGWPFRFHRQPGTDAERVEDGYESEKCYRVFAVSDAAVLGMRIFPGRWNLDEYPFIRFAYRIPEGTPIGLAIQLFSQENVAHSTVLMGGTASHDSGSYPDTGTYELIDDGQWHQITLDIRCVRQIHEDLDYIRGFRFYTAGNADKGQEFWFDEFSILPDVEAGAE